ncbi:uncharacterized protein [Diadema setosum]|uniref:uncharacterized protein n=1 Tax=Diadema setosum TaxID=31175 RepID=UPI003B3A7768
MGISHHGTLSVGVYHLDSELVHLLSLHQNLRLKNSGMASKTILFLLGVIAFVAVARALELDADEGDEDFELEMIKRDPEMMDFLLAEKRGRNMKKYKTCTRYNQQCLCGRRSGRVYTCLGANPDTGV